MTTSLKHVVGRVLSTQVAWAVLAALWNVAGVYLISQGQRPLGPTATITGAVALVAIAAALVLTVNRASLLYAVLSGVAAFIALAAVVNAFVQDPALWPSEFWRYAGAVLNGVGFLAGAAAVLAYLRWKSR
jgi:hypothetical protein